MSPKYRYKCRLNCRLNLAPFVVLKMSLYVPVNVHVKEYDGKMSVKKWLVVGKMSINDAKNEN